MKKLEFRAIICLVMAGCIVIGLLIFVYQMWNHGDKWATFYANKHIYTNGKLARGNIYDINGMMLEENKDGELQFNPDYWVRRGTVQVVGDRKGNVATSAEMAYRDRIVGYNFLTGTYSVTGTGQNINLTIDGRISAAAAKALGDRSGLIGIYNYKTGDIVTMVSGPNYDPMDIPQVDGDDDSGLFINKVLSGHIVPGSIFKTVTSAAAIEGIKDIEDFHFNCPGYIMMNGTKIDCFQPHGHVTFHSALGQSCNASYAQFTTELGADTMKQYVTKLGLNKSYDIDGIRSAKGSFDFPEDNVVKLAWAGIGQHKDQINPLSMMVYIGAIANGGRVAEPRLLYKPFSTAKMSAEMLKPETAAELQVMMREAVTNNYGDANFPNLEVYAKSGTAQLLNQEPHAWLTGFIKDPDHPYAFIICVEHGGYGSVTCVPIINQVLQEAVNGESQ